MDAYLQLAGGGGFDIFGEILGHRGDEIAVRLLDRHVPTLSGLRGTHTDAQGEGHSRKCEAK